MPASDFPKLIVPLLCLARDGGLTCLQQGVRDAAHCGHDDNRLGVTHGVNNARSLIDLRNGAY